jgi:PhnB protein
MAQIAWKPAQYHSLTPYLTLRGAAKAIEFYRKAFGAEELYRMAAPDGTVMHAELRIGDSVVMLGEEAPEMGASSPATLGGSTAGLLIYVERCDEAFQRAIQAGATALQPPVDMFWGDRYGQLKDPFGHRWSIATHVKDLSPEEMAKAQEAWTKENAARPKAS